MGLVGKYLDALSDEQRDRVIEAGDFNDGNKYFDDDGCACLVGVAERDSFSAGGRWLRSPPVDLKVGENYFGNAGDNFPSLIMRFGKARIVAACKARAARGNAPKLTEIRSEVYRELVPVGGMNGRFPEDC